MRWPETDRDVRTVGSVVERSHATVARIFLPLPSGGVPVSWSEIAAAAGIEFTAETTWAELDATGVPDSLGLGSPYVGCLSSSATDANSAKCARDSSNC